VIVTPPVGSRRSRFRITDNVSEVSFGSPQALMRFTRIDSLEVRGNINPMQVGRQMIGVSVVESCHVIVRNNIFSASLNEFEIQPYSCT
jgi:hypothetical protein